MPGVAYRWMEVTGPHNPVAAAPLIPAHSGQVESYLRRFLRAAYRRPPTEAEAVRFLLRLSPGCFVPEVVFDRPDQGFGS